MSIRDKIRAMARRPQGCTSRDIEGITPAKVIETTSQMLQSGMLFTVGARCERRYFLKESDAATYRTITLPMLRSVKKKEHQNERNARSKISRDLKKKMLFLKEEIKPKTNKKKPAKVAGVHIPGYIKVRWVERDALITTKTKITICPSPSAYGQAGRLLNVSEAQMNNDLPKITVGQPW